MVGFFEMDKGARDLYQSIKDLEKTKDKLYLIITISEKKPLLPSVCIEVHETMLYYETLATNVYQTTHQRAIQYAKKEEPLYSWAITHYELKDVLREKVSHMIDGSIKRLGVLKNSDPKLAGEVDKYIKELQELQETIKESRPALKAR